MTARRLWIQVALLFAVLYLALLGVRPLITPDEPRYAAMGADMLAGGDWFKLRMAGFTYYEKPPLGVWLIAASEAVFGHTAFAVRLPGALASLVSALAAGMVARRVTGREQAAPLAALVQLTTVFPMVIGTFAVLDPVFTAFTSLTLAWFLAGAQSKGRARVGWLLASGAAAGMAFLTKGLLAFAIPALAAGGWLAWERRWRELFTLPWLPMAGAAVAAGPLAWLIHRSEPGFWNSFVMVEHFRRFAKPDANQHAEPWWLLGLVLVGGSLFWMVVWPRALGALKGRAEAQSGLRFCVAWVVLPLALLSMSAGKLPTYVLPLFPPISALVAAGLLRWRESVERSRDAGTTVVIALTGLLAAAAFVLALTGGRLFGLPTLWSTGEGMRWTVIGLAFLAWALLEARSHRAGEAAQWLARAAWVPVPALLCVHVLLPDAVLSAPKNPWALLARHDQALRSADTLVLVNSVAHAVNWTTGRTDMVILGDASEFDNELDLPQDRSRLVPYGQLDAAAARWITHGSVTLLIDAGTAERLAKAHPALVRRRETDRDLGLLVLAPAPR